MSTKELKGVGALVTGQAPKKGPRSPDPNLSASVSGGSASVSGGSVSNATSNSNASATSQPESQELHPGRCSIEGRFMKGYGNIAPAG